MKRKIAALSILFFLVSMLQMPSVFASPRKPPDTLPSDEVILAFQYKSEG